MTHPVMIIIAWLTHVKKASRGAPLCPILPSVIPITVENTTRPMMLVPCAYSCEISQSCKFGAAVQDNNKN